MSLRLPVGLSGQPLSLGLGPLLGQRLGLSLLLRLRRFLCLALGVAVRRLLRTLSLALRRFLSLLLSSRLLGRGLSRRLLSLPIGRFLRALRLFGLPLGSVLRLLCLSLSLGLRLLRIVGA